MEYYTFNKMLIPDYLEYDEQLNFLFHVNTYGYNIPHGHADYWEFTLITEGVLENHIQNRVEKIPANTLFFHTTKDEHFLRKASHKNLRYINILVRETHLMKLLDVISPTFKEKLLTGPRAYAVPMELVAKTDDILHKITLLPSQRFKPFYNDSLSSAFLQLLQYLFTLQIEFLPEMSEKKLHWLQLLKEVMQQPNSQKYTVKDLCEKLNYSRMQLNRLFNEHLNTSPHQYLLDFKLSYAQNLLRNSELKLADIAVAVGYTTLSQFNSNFKKKFGLTPKEYRRPKTTTTL